MDKKQETRYTGCWKVEVRSKGHGYAPRRKVVTEKETLRYEIRDLDDIMADLRAGHEVRLTYRDQDCIRLFPLMDTRCKGMNVIAQSMGYFRDCLSDIKPKIIKVSRKECKEIEATDVNQMTERAHLQRAERTWVTPDTVVACPKCGFEFRIGRPAGK